MEAAHLRSLKQQCFIRRLHICVPEAAAFWNLTELFGQLACLFGCCSLKKKETMVSKKKNDQSRIWSIMPLSLESWNLRHCRNAHVHFLKSGSLLSPVTISPAPSSLFSFCVSLPFQRKDRILQHVWPPVVYS